MIIDFGIVYRPAKSVAVSNLQTSKLLKLAGALR